MALAAATTRCIVSAAMTALPTLFAGRLSALVGLANGCTCRHIVIRFKPVDILAGNMALDYLFDTIELLDFIGTDQ